MKIIYLFLLCLAACGKPLAPQGQAKPRLLVSIAPYKSLVQRVAGPDFDVQMVVPDGANPHVYEPTAKQVVSIASGDIWFRIGEPFEDKILPVLQEKNPLFTAIDLREGIELIALPDLSCSHCATDHTDRHIWLSPQLTAQQMGRVKRALSEKFPEKKEQFEENAKLLAKELAALDEEISAIVSQTKETVLLVSHPAFGYFCRDYHLTQLSIEYEGKDPRPRHLEAILQRAVDAHAGFALALPQHNNKGAQRIAEQLHVPVRVIDPYSASYFEMMRRLAHIVADPRRGS